MDLASVVAALASVGVRVSGSTPNNNIQGDSSRACPTGLADPEPSGTHNDPGQHFHGCGIRARKKGASGGPGAAILPTPLLLPCPLSDLSRTGSMYQQRGVGLDVGAMQPSPIADTSGGVGGRNHPL